MTLVLDELVRFAEDRGIAELVLEYALSNQEAAGAWQRLGSTPSGVRTAAWSRAVRAKLTGTTDSDQQIICSIEA